MKSTILSLQLPNDSIVAAAEDPFLSTAIMVAPSRAKMLQAALPIPLPAPNLDQSIAIHIRQINVISPDITASFPARLMFLFCNMLNCLKNIQWNDSVNKTVRMNVSKQVKISK